LKLWQIKIEVMAFDKTDTITKDEFAVANFQSLSDDIDLNTLIYWASCIESKSSHPFAEAFVCTLLSGCFVYKKGPY